MKRTLKTLSLVIAGCSLAFVLGAPKSPVAKLDKAVTYPAYCVYYPWMCVGMPRPH